MPEDEGKIKLPVKVWQRDWTDLPEELLTLILSCLDPKDDNQFRAVCKTWHSVPVPRNHTPLGFPMPGSQWLIHKRSDQAMCRFFHPLCDFRYCMEIPELLGAVIRFSKDGWLLMSEGRDEIFFFNPFSKAKIELPDLPDREFGIFEGVTFTSTPISSDCIVVVISAYFEARVTISTIRRGEDEWSVQEFINNTPMFPSLCNPVFHEGKLFWLGKTGTLGVFDPNCNQWTILDKPNEEPCPDIQESYLIDCDGKLMSVFVGTDGCRAAVFELDEPKMVWDEVNDLDGNMLFLSADSSFMRKSTIEKMKNKIYFPRFHDKKHCVLYCFHSGMYETLLDGFSGEDFYDTAELLQCCWMEPREGDCTEEQLQWFDDDSDDESSCISSSDGSTESSIASSDSDVSTSDVSSDETASSDSDGSAICSDDQSDGATESS